MSLHEPCPKCGGKMKQKSACVLAVIIECEKCGFRKVKSGLEKEYVCINCDNQWKAEKADECPECGAKKPRIIETIKLK